jgi:single-stranded DNA-binding protein
MNFINELHVTGRVGTKPEQKGRGPFKFRLAHGGGGKRKDGSPWPVQWFSVSAWDAKLVEGVAVGSPVEIFGKLRDASYVAKDGQQRSAVEIVADSVIVHKSEKQPAPLTPNIHGQVITDEDVPF